MRDRGRESVFGIMRLAILLLFSIAPAAAAANDVRLSSGFGARIDPIDGRRAVHRGLDMPGRAGTEVLAAAAGIVRVAGRRGGYGNLVEIAHPDGSATRYAHLSRIHVREGEPVAQGQLIARIGSTGRSTGNHLHFEYRLAGVAVDPTPFFGSVPTLDYRSRRAEGSAEAPHRSRFAAARDGDAPAQAMLPDGSQVVRARGR